MVRFILILLTVLMISIDPANAQLILDPDQKITPQKYEIFINLPEDFHLAYRVGSFPNYLEEYIPIGEKVEEWSEMYSIGYLGQIQGRDFSDIGEVMGASLTNACENAKIFFNETKRSGDVIESIDLGYMCTGRINAGVTITEDTVLRDVEVILMRYVFIDGNIHTQQRAWHGSREEYEAFENFDEQVQIWRKDLDRFYVCKFADVENLCPGIDREDQSEAGIGKDYAFFVVSPENQENDKVNKVLNKIVYGQDNIETNQAAINTATNAYFAYRSGQQTLIIIQFENLPEMDDNGNITNRDYPQARVDIVSFLFLVQQLLYDIGVPAEKMGFALVNFHPF